MKYSLILGSFLMSIVAHANGCPEGPLPTIVAKVCECSETYTSPNNAGVSFLVTVATLKVLTSDGKFNTSIIDGWICGSIYQDPSPDCEKVGATKDCEGYIKGNPFCK